MWAWSPFTPTSFSSSGVDTPPPARDTPFHRQVMDELDQAIAEDMSRRGYGPASQGRYAFLARLDATPPLPPPPPTAPATSADLPVSSVPSSARSSIHPSPRRNRGLSGLAIFPDKEPGRRPLVRTAGAPPVRVSDMESNPLPADPPSGTLLRSPAACQTHVEHAGANVNMGGKVEADLHVEELSSESAQLQEEVAATQPTSSLPSAPLAGTTNTALSSTAPPLPEPPQPPPPPLSDASKPTASPTRAVPLTTPTADTDAHTPTPPPPVADAEGRPPSPPRSPPAACPVPSPIARRCFGDPLAIRFPPLTDLQMRRAFWFLDPDSTGHVGEQELHVVLRAAGCPLPREQLPLTKLSFPAFRQALIQLWESLPHNDLPGRLMAFVEDAAEQECDARYSAMTRERSDLQRLFDLLDPKGTEGVSGAAIERLGSALGVVFHWRLFVAPEQDALTFAQFSAMLEQYGAAYPHYAVAEGVVALLEGVESRPIRRLSVTVKAARDIPEGEVYAEVVVDGHAKATRTRKCTPHPDWEETLEFSVPSSQPGVKVICVMLKHRDPESGDRVVGQASVAIAAQRGSLINEYRLCPPLSSATAGFVTIAVRLYFQEPAMLASVGQPYHIPPLVSTPHSRRRALVVGINYVASHLGRLWGCINDARRVAEMLCQQYAFPPTAVRVLTDEASEESLVPSAGNLRHALFALLEGVEAGDAVVFHFSGHGSQVLRKDATGEDCLHDCLCPVDMDWGDNAIDSDEVDHILIHECPPGVRVTCIFDCCHAAGHSADAGQAAGRPKERHPSARCQPPPVPILNRIAAVDPLPPRPRPGPSQEAKSVAMLTGSQMHHAALDTVLEGSSHGALTWAMLKVLCKSQYRITAEGLCRAVRQLLWGQKLSQVPGLLVANPEGLGAPFISSHEQL